jgi:SAM-dependent methyltransferase
LGGKNKMKLYTKENSMKWQNNKSCGEPARVWINTKVKKLSRKEKLSLLDIGCGTGLWTKKFSKTTRKVVGLDLEKNMIDICNEKNSSNKIKYIQGNFNNLDKILHGEKFDIITALASLHYIQSKNKLITLFKQIQIHLSKKGHLLFYVPHPFYLYTKNNPGCRVYFDAKYAYNDNFPFRATINLKNGETREGAGYFHTMEEYIGDLIKSGFKIVEMKELTIKGDKLPASLVIDAVKA